MRRSAIICTIALGVMAAQDAAADDVVIQNCHGLCLWSLIVSSPSLRTQDLYPAADSREDCERIIEQFRTAHPDGTDEMECLDNSRPDTWPHPHFPSARPSNAGGD